MREIWFAALAALVLLGPLPAGAQPAKPPSPSAQAEALALTPDDRILGKSDAPVTIVEYASLTCPHCAHFTTDVLPKLKEKWIDTGKARVVMRDYPLDEPALRAAMITRCAPTNKFYAFIDTLFGAQFMAIGFMAELFIAYCQPDQPPYSISEKTEEKSIANARDS